MATLNKPRTEEVLMHLGYEWWMLRSTMRLLQCIGNNHNGDPVRNALLESLIIHCRGLIDFFFNGSQKKRADDWTAENLGQHRKDKPPGVSAWLEEANKRVAHITEKRAEPLGSWNIEAIRLLLSKEIDSVRIDSVRMALGTGFPSDWLGDASVESHFISPPALRLQAGEIYTTGTPTEIMTSGAPSKTVYSGT